MKVEFKPFDECLNSLTRKQFIEILKNDFNNIDTIADDLLLKIARPFIFLKYMQKVKKIQLFKQHTIAEKLYSEKYNEVHEEFYNDGLIFKNNDTCYVPTEYKHYLLDELESVIRGYMLYYIMLNGVLEKFKLFSLLRESGIEETDEYFESLMNNNILHDEKYVYFDKVSFRNIEIEKFIKLKNESNYKIIKNDDIYEETKMFIQKIKFNELNKFFVYIRNKTIIDKIKDSLVFILCMNLDIKTNIMKVLKEYNITLKDINKLCKYIEINLVNDFPIWGLNGYTIKEYEENNK